MRLTVRQVRGSFVIAQQKGGRDVAKEYYYLRRKSMRDPCQWEALLREGSAVEATVSQANGRGVASDAVPFDHNGARC